MKKFTANTSCIITLAFMATLLSCSNYYKAIQAGAGNNIEKATKIDSLNQANRTFILRNSDQAFYLSNPVTNAAENVLECTLDTLSESNRLHLTKGRNGNMRYKNEPSDLSVLNEVHVYVTLNNTPALGKNSIPLDKIQKIEVIEKDKKRTSNSHALGGVGITLGVLAVTGIILYASFAASFGSGW